MGVDNDIFHKFTHKSIPITIIYDQLPNGPLVLAVMHARKKEKTLVEALKN